MRTPTTTRRSTFVLIHGAWHGAWCWSLLEEELARRGHQSVSMDLPAGDPVGLDHYAASITAAVAASTVDTDELVIVGHSLGGLVAPIVADRLAAAGVVYLCAFVPTPGLSFEEQVEHERAGMFAPTWPDLARRQQTLEDGSSRWPPDDAITAFFHDCPPELALDSARSLRSQHWELTKEPCPMSDVTRMPAAAVLCRNDRAIDADWLRHTSTTLLGRAAEELPGGHSPMLAQPGALADVLVRLADSFEWEASEDAAAPAPLQRARTS